MNVSIIIPAYNVAGSLPETLKSLFDQTSSNWEAIIVNDGSKDDTAKIAQQFVAKDKRVRLIDQPNGGVSVARNTGITQARYGWLLFLDADDLIAPTFLEELTTILHRKKNVDAVYCGWARLAPDGSTVPVNYTKISGRLFPEFAKSCAFAIHTCIFRRSLIDEVGNFDTSLKIGEDWDLWQRISRTGAYFETVDKVLAYYRMTPNSASVDGVKLLYQTLRVVDRVHRPDPRVKRPYPQYAAGMTREKLPETKYYMLCWAAGLMLGAGKDPHPLFELIDESEPNLDTYTVAVSLFEAAMLPKAKKPNQWHSMWFDIQPHLNLFLELLENRSKSRRLAKRVFLLLERLVANETISDMPVTIGTTYLLNLEVTDPLYDISVPDSIQRLTCVINVNGNKIGTIELPVFNGLVTKYVLADAIAAKYAWQILGRFFEQLVYQTLHFEEKNDMTSVWRGPLCLGKLYVEDWNPFWDQIYSAYGWTLFLQEIWGLPDCSLRTFYQYNGLKNQTTVLQADNSHVILELSQALPTVKLNGPRLKIIASLGGAFLGTFIIKTHRGTVPAHKIRAVITQQAGVELCRVAVREGLLGQPFTSQADSLRKRLQTAAQAASNINPVDKLKQNNNLIIGRRSPEVIGTSASRRATLPGDAASLLLEKTSSGRGTVIYHPTQPEQVTYAPDLFCNGKTNGPPQSHAKLSGSNGSANGHALTDRGEAKQAQARSTSIRSGHILQRFAPFIQTASQFFGLPGLQKHINRLGFAVTERLPVLMYHRVAPTGLAKLNRYRVTPDIFEAQLKYLKRNGFYSVDLETWRAAALSNTPLPGRAIHLTFDDGFRDFLEYAWPLLKKYGFTATVFLVSNLVGKTNIWDEAYGEKLPLLTWQEIRKLQAEGVNFGSHTATHPHLTTLSNKEIICETATSRTILERQLSISVRSIAYPYGDVDPIVQHLAGACGYTFGLSCNAAKCTYSDDLLLLPRIEIEGTDDLSKFIEKLNW